jgi:glycosyltransferase involved in cell wall biosynthesis
MTSQRKGGVIYLGLSYYNNFYLSRALRRRGWVADLVSHSGEGAEQFQHGYDFRFDYDKWDRQIPIRRVKLLERILRRFAGDYKVGDSIPVASPRQQAILKRVMTRYLRLVSGAQRAILDPLRAGIHHYDIFHFTGVHNLRFFYYFNPSYFGSQPITWDLVLLKRLGKKIVYSNTSCNDGVTPSTFRQWKPYPVCDVCSWRDVPSVCSDDLMHRWGQLRNWLVDYQMTCGGNRADYNDDPRVHEVPEFFCLDPSVWSPDLLIPANYRLPLPASTVKIYHAVGNFTLRSEAATSKNIKSTHIYLEVVDRLKAEGYDTELIFFHDVPNKQVRFYQAQADIVVDMLTFGFFGANVREALMLGKPVVCFLRPEWLETIRRELPGFVEELPIVSATPETVYEALRDLIERPERRRELGRRGRAFALKWFSTEAGARRVDTIYSAMLRGEEPPSREGLVAPADEPSLASR